MFRFTGLFFYAMIMLGVDIIGINYFTKEQIELLSNNKYVIKVSEKSITYSDEVKLLFLQESNNGLTPKLIFEKYELIHKLHNNPKNKLKLSWLCEYAGVSRSGYYSWINNQGKINEKEINDRKDFEIILNAYNYRGYAKGVNGIYMRLKREGIIFNKKKIRRLMRKFNLNCPIRKPNPYKKCWKKCKHQIMLQIF